MTIRPPERQELQDQANALPFIEGDDESVLDEKRVLAFLLDIETSDSQLPEHIQLQIDGISVEVEGELEPAEAAGYFFISEDILRGVVSRSVKAGAAQAASDIGEELRQGEAIRRLVEGDPVELDGTSAA